LLFVSMLSFCLVSQNWYLITSSFWSSAIQFNYHWHLFHTALCSTFIFTFYCKEHTLRWGYFLQPKPNYYTITLWLGKGVLNVFSIFLLFFTLLCMMGVLVHKFHTRMPSFHQFIFIKFILILILICMSSLHIYISI